VLDRRDVRIGKRLGGGEEGDQRHIYSNNASLRATAGSVAISSLMLS
jgi:hypothetical protein